jgi:hypothetical protein
MTNSELLKELEDECRAHDFFGEYSDDFRVWQASFRRNNLINSLLTKLDNSVEAIEVYNNYAPDEYKL